jgi:hypothetical protein
MITDLWVRRVRYGRNRRIERTDLFFHDLARHPGFQAWRTPISKVRDQLEQTGDPEFSDGIGAAYAAYAEEHGKRWWGDKTPRYLTHINLLADLFPMARFVHVIRDGRDVALSEVDLHRLHRRAASIAFMWRRKLRAGRAAANAVGERYTELRYEDLLSEPERELRRICRFLGFGFEPAMLVHDPEAIREGLRKMPASARAQHQHLLLPPTNGLRDWRTQMSQREIAEFEAIAGKVLMESGYPLADTGVSIVDRLMAWLHVAEFAARSTGPRLRFRRLENLQWRDTDTTDVGTAADPPGRGMPS